jgi:hypothetical protein
MDMHLVRSTSTYICGVLERNGVKSPTSPGVLVGRGLTMQNLSVFLGVAVVQSVSGVIIGQFSTDGVAGEFAYRMFFGFLAGVVLLGLLLYVPARDVRPE